MIPLPPPNTRAHPYRGLSMQETDIPLTSASIEAFLVGREVYRRTDFLVLRDGGGRTALVAVRKASVEPLFSPVVEARVLAGPDDAAWVVVARDVTSATRPRWPPRPCRVHGRASCSGGSSTSTSSGSRRRSGYG